MSGVTVLLQPIYDALEPRKAAALFIWHALIGCDTTGAIRGKGKQIYTKTISISESDVVFIVISLDLNDEPSTEVAERCDIFVCPQKSGYLISQSKVESVQIKPDPLTPGAWV